jgi:hypothetical protein
MSTTTKTLYDTDFVEWTAHTAQLVREGRFEELDLENLAEEIEDLGKSDRSAVRSQLSRMLMHLVKERIQPERAGASWRSSIVDARREILIKLEDSPSLKRHLAENLQKIYRAAVRDALDKTNLMEHVKDFDIPRECTYTLDELLEGDVSALDRPLR